MKGGYDFFMEIEGDGIAAPGKPGEAVAEAGEGKAVPVAAAADDLAKRVDELNELCGDTWCEGSFNYKFTKLSCDGDRGCALAFTASNSDTKKNYDAMVVVKGFTELRQDPNKEFKFEGSFDEAVGNALSAWEANPVSKPGAITDGKKVAAAGKGKAAAPAKKKTK